MPATNDNRTANREQMLRELQEAIARVTLARKTRNEWLELHAWHNLDAAWGRVLAERAKK